MFLRGGSACVMQTKLSMHVDSWLPNTAMKEYLGKMREAGEREAGER